MPILENSPIPISLQGTSNIMDQMKTCIFKIYISNKGYEIKGSGFFCLIPFHNKKFPVIITNNHVLDEKILEKEKFISLELNNLIKKIQINDNRKIYTNRNYDITIIEIIPEKDNIFNFLELDEKIFFEDSDLFLRRLSIYLLYSGKTISVSYGLIININGAKISHNCNSDNGSAGGPIFNFSTQKVIGIHIGSSNMIIHNAGTLLKYHINEFINLHKDYISTNSIFLKNDINKINTSINNINEIKLSEKALEKSNKELEKRLILEREKNRKLIEKINQLNDLLKNDSKNNVSEEHSNDLLQLLVQKEKKIEELRLKLSKSSLELSGREKLISIIFTSTDKKFLHSVICKNTDIFYNLELKLYQKYKEYSKLENYFTINERKINKTKNLEFNKIKVNDIIILNTLDH